MLETIVDLGLVYSIEVRQASDVTVWMTLTTPHHPQAQEIVQGVRAAILTLPGVASVDVQLVSDPQPPWTPYRLAPALRAPLGLPDQPPPAPFSPPPASLSRRIGQRLRRLAG